MTTVIQGDLPEVQALIDKRRALGQDGHDEVWEGVYHVVPHAGMRHARVQAELMRVLSPRVEAQGCYVTQEFNLGDPDDYRVPDIGVHRAELTELYAPTAVAVAEVLSPGDATYDKFDFFRSLGVQEILVVEPVYRWVKCWRATSTGLTESDRIECAELTCSELVKLIRWP